MNDLYKMSWVCTSVVASNIANSYNVLGVCQLSNALVSLQVARVAHNHWLFLQYFQHLVLLLNLVDTHATILAAPRHSCDSPPGILVAWFALPSVIPHSTQICLCRQAQKQIVPWWNCPTYHHLVLYNNMSRLTFKKSMSDFYIAFVAPWSSGLKSRL